MARDLQLKKALDALREALEEIAGACDGTPAQILAEDALAAEPSAEARDREFTSKLFARVEALKAWIVEARDKVLLSVAHEQSPRGAAAESLGQATVALLSSTPPTPAPRTDAKSELGSLRARVEALEGALRRVALGAHSTEEFPDRPAHWAVKLTCRRCGAIGENIDHLDSRHRDDCPTAIARAALGPTPARKFAPRPDATDAMRVALEALVGSEHALSFCRPDNGSPSDDIAKMWRDRNSALDAARAAIEQLRAHVEGTPLEAAVQGYAEVSRG